MPKTVVELLACWQGHFGFWAPHCLIWCLWRERNNQSFENIEKTMAELKLFFFRTFWIGYLCCTVRPHGLLMIDICNLCDWLYCPQLYTPCILGWLYLFISIKFHYLSKKIDSFAIIQWWTKAGGDCIIK